MSLLGSFNLGLPDFSSAAWRASQASPAASYFDFDWVIEVSRAYETCENYSRMADQVIGELSSQFDTGLDRVAAIHGKLAILTSLHGSGARAARGPPGGPDARRRAGELAGSRVNEKDRVRAG